MKCNFVDVAQYAVAILGVDPSLILLCNNCNVAAAGSVSPVAPCLPGPAGG